MNEKKNEIILNEILKQYTGLNQITITDNKIVYGNKEIDISNFDMSSLLSEDFINSLQGLNVDELFESLNKKIAELKTKDIEDKWKVVVKENPLMNNITIFSKKDKDIDRKVEFINIRTSDGQNHLFRNDINMDIFNEYNKLKASYGDNVTPDMLAREIEKWKKDRLDVKDAEKTVNNTDALVSFQNKVRELQDKFKDVKEINIEVNEEEEIVYLNNSIYPEKNVIITFEPDINNELEMIVHSNNVSSFTTGKENSENNEEVKDMKTENIIDTYNYDTKGMEYNESTNIISEEQFYELLKVNGEYSDKEREEIDFFYKDISDRIKQKDPSIEEFMNRYKENVEIMELSDYTNVRQEEAIQMFYRFKEELLKAQGLETGKAYTLNNDRYMNNDNNEGYANNILMFIIASLTVIVGMIILMMVVK